MAVLPDLHQTTASVNARDRNAFEPGFRGPGLRRLPDSQTEVELGAQSRMERWRDGEPRIASIPRTEGSTCATDSPPGSSDSSNSRSSSSTTTCVVLHWAKSVLIAKRRSSAHSARVQGQRMTTSKSGSCYNCLIIGFCLLDFAFCAHNFCAEFMLPALGGVYGKPHALINMHRLVGELVLLIALVTFCDTTTISV